MDPFPEAAGLSLRDVINQIEERFSAAGLPRTTILVQTGERARHEITADLPAFDLSWSRPEGEGGGHRLCFLQEPLIGGDLEPEQIELALRCVPGLWQAAHDHAAALDATDGPLRATALQALQALVDP